MIDLHEELELVAQRVVPEPDLDGVLRRVRHRRTKRRTTMAIVAVLVLLGGLTTATLLRHRDRSHPADRPVPIAGLVVAGAPVSQSGAAAGRVTTLDRHDATAADGSWSVVVRAADGELGYHSAIVTSPVAASTSGDPITIGAAIGRVDGSTIIWPVDGGGFARLRSDLPREQMVAIAGATRIVAGRPVVAELDGFTVQPARPFRAPDVHEVRLYDNATTLGFVYTGVVVAGFFEDQLLFQPDRTSATVQGHRGVVSAIQGGNATLAWEPQPGVVVYVGYSGAGLDDAVLAELTRVANSTSTIDDAAWTATAPQVVDDHNGPSDM